MNKLEGERQLFPSWYSIRMDRLECNAAAGKDWTIHLDFSSVICSMPQIRAYYPQMQVGGAYRRILTCSVKKGLCAPLPAQLLSHLSAHWWADCIIPKLNLDAPGITQSRVVVGRHEAINCAGELGGKAAWTPASVLPSMSCATNPCSRRISLPGISAYDRLCSVLPTIE